MRGFFRLGWAAVLLPAVFCTSLRAEVPFEGETLPIELTVGYAVRAIDLSGDGRLDIAIVDSDRFVWLENPSWAVHVMHQHGQDEKDNVCFAPHDIDGDGDVDFAVGRDWQPGNSKTGGKIGWLECPVDPRQSWSYQDIAQEPTVHRMRWIDWNGSGEQRLVVLPLKGRGATSPRADDVAVRMLELRPSASKPVSWTVEAIDQSLHVSHNIDVVDMNEDGRHELLAASYEGVTHMAKKDGRLVSKRLGSGFAGEPPAAGSSEVRLGRADNKDYIATIEPWHGDRVVVYTPPTSEEQLWVRHELDDQLKWGHAVACADLDGDPDQELIIGVRDDTSNQHRSGVRIYDPVDVAAGKWSRQLVAPGEVAVEDLVVSDLDGDGDQDIIAVGRATHNAVIYWNGLH